MEIPKRWRKYRWEVSLRFKTKEEAEAFGVRFSHDLDKSGIDYVGAVREIQKEKVR